MRPRASWRPFISDGDAPLADRLAQAIAADITAGRLAAGERLPAHRDLAADIGVAVGTVTRAYALLQRRGLVSGRRGSGMYVTEAPAAPDGPIDLSLNYAPPGLAARQVAAAMTAAAERIAAGGLAAYPLPAGWPGHRRAAADWISDHRFDTRAEDVLLCHGAQHALSLALAALARPDDGLLAESAVYGCMFNIAGHARLRLSAVPMDHEGVTPDGLAEAIRRTGARLLYLTPGPQVPTGRIMGLARRQEIVALCRRHDLWIIEDDVYAPLTDRALPPLAALAPERVLWVGGLSKVIGPALRLGFLRVPAAVMPRVEHVVASTTLTGPVLAGAVLEQLMADGTAGDLTALLRREAAERLALAHRLLPRFVPADHPLSLHVWLDLPDMEAAERLTRRCLERGVRVTPPGTTVLAPEMIAGVRLCLGGVPTQAALAQALGAVAEAASAREPALM